MRARSLKPSLFKNEILGSADPLLTILFEGLWCEADREGRLEDRPLRIKAEVFPYREGLDINALLSWLTENEFIRRYKVRGVAVIQVIKFLEHQRPHNNEVASVLPSFDEAQREKEESTSNQGKKSAQPRKKALRSDSGLLTPDSPFLTPDSGNHDASVDASSASPPAPNPVDQVFGHWQAEWNHPNAKLDPKRQKRIEARLKDFTVQQLRDAISGYKHSPWHTGTDPKGNGVVYDGIETLLQDTAHVETGLRLLAHPPRPPPKLEQLSPVERVLRANGVTRDDRVVSEQARSSNGGLGDVDADVRTAPHQGFRRLGS